MLMNQAHLRYFVLMEEDRKNEEEYRLLLDVIADTSTGAMNRAILVS